MRFYKFLKEAVVKPDLKWVHELVPMVSTLAKHDDKKILQSLNKLFADHFVQFKQTTRQSSDDNLAAAGISYAEMETQEPFKITVYLNDMSVFEDKKEIQDWWIPGLYLVLSHELIHREQYTRMKINKSAKGYGSFKEYYQDKQEIMALAHDIVLHALGLGFSKVDMANMNIEHWLNFERFQEFSSHFTPKDPEWKQLLKYVYQYVDKL